MLTFKSEADLSRLKTTDPAHPVISRMIEYDALDTDNIIALMEPHDIGRRTELWDHCHPGSVSLEGILHKQGMYLVVLHTEMQFGIVVVIPDASWLTGDLRQSIQQTLKFSTN